ncbi:MAG: hypothetical protein ABI925_11355 [Verrucomicrobiota bacterium]
MRSFLFGALGAVSVIGSFVLGVLDLKKSPKSEPWLDASRMPDAPRFEIHEEGQRIFIFDKANARAWRYYINRDDKGKMTDEGFAQLHFVNLPDAPVDFTDLLPTPTPLGNSQHLIVTPTPSPKR